MQRLSGVLMVLAGAALGGYVVLPAPQNGAERLTEVPRISAAPDRDVTIAVAQPVSAPAQQPPTSIVPNVVPTGAASNTPRVFSPASPLAPAQTAAATPSTAPGMWTAVVTTESAAKGQLKSSRAGDSETRAVLASDLQRELKRVGCYDGEVTGTWSTASKTAMSAFMERVNATLPVNEPDYILLTLVQGHAANACGTDCPSGQVQSEAGRCVPRAVVAQAARKTQREEDRRAEEGRKAKQQELLAQEQRETQVQRVADARKAAAAKAADAMRIAAAKTEAAKPAVVAAAPKIIVPKPQQTAQINTETLPWLKDDKSGSKSTSVVAAAAPPRGQPPEGMMSVGGPRDTAPEVPASATAVTPDKGPSPAMSPIDTTQTITAVPDDVVPPAPQLAIRPVKVAARPTLSSAGLPGTKSGPAVHRSVAHSAPKYLASKSTASKYRAARIVKRPPPVFASAPKFKPYTYASNSGGGKLRRGQPRQGTAHYNLMLSLGGIY
jgi:hypothetical protein